MRSGRDLAWFKRGIQVDAKFCGVRNGHRVWNKITVFSYGDDRRDHINTVIAEVARYGYSDVTIDKLMVYK